MEKNSTTIERRDAKLSVHMFIVVFHVSLKKFLSVCLVGGFSIVFEICCLSVSVQKCFLKWKGVGRSAIRMLKFVEYKREAPF